MARLYFARRTERQRRGHISAQGIALGPKPTPIIDAGRSRYGSRAFALSLPKGSRGMTGVGGADPCRPEPRR